MFNRKLEFLIFIICVTFIMVISNYLYFHVKYNKKLFGMSDVRTEDLYTKYINTFMLIFIAIELNNLGGIYTYLSFILTYIICAKLDRLYRDKFEKVLKQGDKEIQKYIKKNKTLSLKAWFKIQIKCFKEGYKDSFKVFQFKFKLGIIFIFAYMLFRNFNTIMEVLQK